VGLMRYIFCWDT